MRITGWRIDGYGALVDETVDGLPPGLTVVHGPNEAGKSTLLSFVRHILFGFPDRRTKEDDRPPVRGGRHGGALFLADESGDYVLERHAATKEATLTTAAGTPLEDAALARLRGGADRALFAAVFAFGLEELASLRTLQADEVRDRVFSAGVLGAGRSAHAAERVLQGRQDALVRPRATDARANSLVKSLADIDEQLRSAQKDAADYPGEAARRAALDEELASARRREEHLRDRINELDLLSGNWTTQDAADSARQRLTALDASPGEVLLATEAATLERLAAQRDARDADRLRRERLAAHRDELARVLTDERAALRALGAPERPEALRADDLEALDDLVRRHGEMLAVAGERRRELARAEEDQRDAAAALATAGAREPRSADELAEVRARLASLRRRIDERDRRAADERWSLVARPTRARIGSGVVAVLLVLVVLLTAAAALAARTHAVLPAVLAGIGAFALLVLVAFLARERAEARGDEATGRGAEDLAAARADVGDRARALGLPDAVTTADVDDELERIGRDEDARRAFDRIAEAAHGADAAVRRAEAGVGEADAQVDVLDKERRALAQRVGLPAELDAARLVDAARHSGAAAAATDEMRRVDEELFELDASLAREEHARHALFQRLAPAFENDAPPDDLDVLLARARAAVARAEERERCESARAAAENHLTAAFGAGDRADRLRVELATGQILAWQRERTELADALQHAEARAEELVAARTRVEVRLGTLVSSADIADLELARGGIVAELDAALVAFATDGAAKALVRRTLQRYERERQPAVIRAAGELFAEVTGGRYQALVARESTDGRSSTPGIEALAPGGRRVESDRLSRGAQEQLYLCLRLALASTFAERAARLPLVLDDVLVNFDPGRAAAVARALARTARDNQVLAFTCHPHVVALLKDALPDARVVELARLP